MPEAAADIASDLVPESATEIAARAPGRVNLMGDHTDYTGGLVLPMAIDRWTVVRGVRGGTRVLLRSDAFAEVADVGLGSRGAPADRGSAEGAAVEGAGVEGVGVEGVGVEGASWVRYVAALVEEFAPAVGFAGTVRSTVPIGAGLASSAALEVACALAFGHRGDAIALAQRCQRAEHRATGTPTGIMDQLACVYGRAGHALLIDCTSLAVLPIPLPPASEVEIVVVHSGVRHELAETDYGERVASCRQAEHEIGPLRSATLDDVARIADPTVRARARHVVNENARVRTFARDLAAGDLVAAGRSMHASHASLRDDYQVSVPAIDDLVARIDCVPGVFGVRMTGGGFGGCVVALCRPGALDHWGARAWPVRAVDGASLQVVR